MSIFSGRLVDLGGRYDTDYFIAPFTDVLTEACINGIMFPNNLL
jgi:hypothetical protein